MGKTRQQELIDSIRNELELIERQLIETAESTTMEECQKLVNEAIMLREAMKIIEKL